MLGRNQNPQISTTAANNRCSCHKCKWGKRNSHMKHLELFFSFLAIPSLALLVGGCGGGDSSVGQTVQIITFDNPAPRQ